MLDRLYPTERKNATCSVAEYVLKAFRFAEDFKRETQKRIIATDEYFKSRSKIPIIIVSGCDEGQQATVNFDSIGQRVDAFHAVSTDATVQIGKPWLIERTEIPDINKDNLNEISETLMQVIGENAARLSGGNEDMFYKILANIMMNNNGEYDAIRKERDAILELFDKEKIKRADKTAKFIDSKVTDAFQQSNFREVIDMALYQKGKYDFCVVRSPDYIRKPVQKIKNNKIIEKDEIVLSTENIHPSRYYCSPDSNRDEDGSFEMDITRISLNDLSRLSTSAGFFKKNIDILISEFKDSSRDWLDAYDDDSDYQWMPYEHIDMIRMSGRVDVDDLYSFVSAKDVKKLKSFFSGYSSIECNVWVISHYLVYMDIPMSKIVRRPYKVDSYSRTGNHKYDGEGIFSKCIEYQLTMNKLMDNLLENAELASGGIIGYNERKIDAENFNPSQIKGGARIPVKSSFSDGGNDRPIFEINFSSHISEIFNTIREIDSMMDARSQIPSFSVGFSSSITSIRSSGIAVTNQKNINKTVIRKLMDFEKYVLTPSFRDISAYYIQVAKSKLILDGAIDIKVSGYSDLIRKSEKQGNLDMVLQNTIGLQNAINQMREQGQDVTGIIEIFKSYIASAGLDADVFFSPTIQSTSNNIAADVGSKVPKLDGRTTNQG